MTYEWNCNWTQRGSVHQGRHHIIVGLGAGHCRWRSMIFSHRLEPDHHFNEFLEDDGDDADFIRLCTEHPDGTAICEKCGFCEDAYYACSEDEMEDE